MEANAPKRIWIDPTNDLSKLSGHIDKDSVEYIRKDSFIEKAADYIKRHSALLDSDGNDCMPKWIEEFKKAMRL